MKTTLQVKQKKHHLGNDIVTIFKLLFANLFFRSIRSNLDVQWVWQAGEEEENHCEGETTQRNIHKIIHSGISSDIQPYFNFNIIHKFHFDFRLDSHT